MELIDRLCRIAVREGASDLFLHAEKVPQFRVNGELVTVDCDAVSAEDLDSLATHCGAVRGVVDFDGSFVASDGSRFRVNLFQTVFKRGAVLRPIKTNVPSLDTLGLPEQLCAAWVSLRAGLVLVTGPTGSGKSTTIAACLEWLNQNYHRHVVTIEDPIEYLFTPARCLFTQREVDTDTLSFAEGLRRSLRQSPDVILLGEIRDSASAVTALQAAETGHLVLATLHSSNVLDSMERLYRLFATHEREGIMQLLSQQLVGVLCQKLVPALPSGRTLALEHFENQAVTRKYIAEGKFRDLADFLAKGDNPANVTFLQSLLALVRDRRIAPEIALQFASNRQELQRQLRGFSATNVKE